MRVWGVVVVAMAMGMSLQSRAYEARVGISSGSRYDSNLFRTDRNKQDDVSFTVSPSVLIDHEQSRLDFELGYNPRYADFIKFDERDRWNHSLSGRANYQLGPATRLSLVDNFSFTENTPRRRIFDNSNEVPEVSTSRNRTLRNVLNMSLSHAFTPRWSSSASAGYSVTEIEGGSRNRSDFASLSSNVSTQYRITARNRVGFGGSYSWFRFDDPNNDDFLVSAGRTQSVHIFASWSLNLSPTLSFSVQGGPTRVIQSRRSQDIRRFPAPQISDEAGEVPDGSRPLFLSLESCSGFGDPRSDGTVSGCNVIQADNTQALVVEDAEVAANTPLADAGELTAVFDSLPSNDRSDDTRDTFFAQAQLVKKWRDVTFIASYRRTQNPESNEGTTSIVDNVTGRLSYRPGNNWRVSATAGFNRRQNTNSQVVERTLFFRDSGLRGRPYNASPFFPANVAVAEFADEEFDVSNTALDVDQIRFGASVGRTLTRRLRANVKFDGVLQNSKGRNARDFDQYRVSAGFSYSFEPIRFF